MTQVSHQDARVVALMLFGPRLAPLHARITALTQAFWPDAPRLYCALPAALAPAADDAVIRCRQDGWVALLREALLVIRERHPECTHVFSLIEDHCPLRPVDGGRLRRHVEAALAGDFACTSFVTYDWPWQTTAPDDRDEQGRVRTWAVRDVFSRGDATFARVPPDFFRYNQCQPGLWQLDYYLALCDEALASGQDSAWAFEEASFRLQQPHVVADYPWPSVHHGFMAQGRVNPEAIRTLPRRPVAAADLRAVLVDDYRRACGRWALLKDVWLSHWLMRVKDRLRPLKVMLWG